MSVKMSEIDYKTFGKCVFLENGEVTVGVTVDVGPRIICYSLEGRENVMLEDTEKVFSELVKDGLGTWYTYGGHRLWLSPEVNPETYSPDNSPVKYSFENGTLVLEPLVTPFGKQFRMEITLAESGTAVDVKQSITNNSDASAEYAAWSITAMAPGGVCVVPMCTRKSGYLPNRVISMWEYVDVYDPRFKLTNECARIRQDSFIKKAFKVGFNVEDNFAAYAVNKQIFVKTFGDYEDVKYPDYACNCEVYTNPLFLEVEMLGAKKSFAPGETAEISERWYLLPNDNEDEPELDKIKNSVFG